MSLEHRIRNWIQLGLQTHSETVSFLQCKFKMLISKYERISTKNSLIGCKRMARFR